MSMSPVSKQDSQPIPQRRARSTISLRRSGPTARPGACPAARFGRMPDNADSILDLDRRIRARGFGQLTLTPDGVPRWTITIRALPMERDDLALFLARLRAAYDVRHERDTIVLHYEHGRLIYAHVTFGVE